MSALAVVHLSEFALDVSHGLSQEGQKRLSSRFFYDELGSSLFEAITLLPEYGLARADERLLRRYGAPIAEEVGQVETVAELGSGSGKKTAHILRPLGTGVTYRPIDISSAALASCQKELCEVTAVKPVQANWLEGLAEVARTRVGTARQMVLFLGSSIGNIDRHNIEEFFHKVRSLLREGDFFLLGADLVNDEGAMLRAYDDPTGVTAAFNKNLLNRLNRELHANFDLRAFSHEVRWNGGERRIEMHLRAQRPQRVFVNALRSAFHFIAGETIWTESSHKFTERELNDYAIASGFKVVKSWIDNEWPFVETLWAAQ